jgi:hypothetical protein
VSELIPQDTTDVATATETLRDRARQLAEGSRAGIVNLVRPSVAGMIGGLISVGEGLG